MGSTEAELERAAEAYEAILVPGLFSEWTELVVEAARITEGQRVLDVACGTGVLARRAAARTGEPSLVTGVDLNPAMLSLARRTAPGIEWREADVHSLPFADASFEVVVSQFGLMFFENRQAGLQEMMRVLVPDGRMAVAVFDSLERIPAYAAMAGVFERQAGKQFGEALRYPFSLGKVDELSSLFSAAGIPSAKIASRQGTAAFQDVEQMVLADVHGWFPVAGLQLDEAALEKVLAEARTALAPFTLPDGSVRFEVSVHLVTATKA